jgi:photosystem II stability/assembly factor-like uncharacterized protein
MSHNTVRGGRVAAFLVLAFLSLAAASAAAPQWTRATPFGGPMVAVAQAPSAPQIVYAATWPGGDLFVSRDGGATWQPRPGLPPEGLVADLAVDPRDPRTVYAQMGSLHRTRNGGRSWAPIGPDLVSAVGFALDTADPGVLYAATSGGLYRSPDGGDTWFLVGFEGTLVLAVAADPRDASTLYAATPRETGGAVLVWKSSDRGATWTAAPPLEFFSFPGTPNFRFDPAQPDTAYLFFSVYPSQPAPLYRTTDGGASWAPLPAAPGVRDVAATPQGLLFAAGDAGIARSSDRGETWAPPLPLPPLAQAPPHDVITRILVDAAAPGALLAVGETGVWRTVDHGTSWEPSNRGIAALYVSSLAVTPAGPPAVVAVAGQSVYRSTDRGDTWARVHSDFDRLQPWTLEAFDPRRPRTLYGIGGDGQADWVLLSANGGRAWRRLPIPYDCDLAGSICEVGVSAVVPDPEHPDTLYVAGGYYFHFIGPGSFLLRSDDGFATWRELPSAGGLLNLAFAPGRGGALYGTSCRRFFKSENAGLRWVRAGRGLPDSLCSSSPVHRALAVDPRDPRRVYVGTGEQGVFASTDGGATFQPLNRGLETGRIATLLVDPADSTRLYAAVAGRGVFRWNAGLRRWTPLNSGLPLAGFEGVLALDPQHPSTLYAGTPEGVFRLDGL